jgi:UDP-2,3-diacylglucosamine pyrophosphatase LpxH
MYILGDLHRNIHHLRLDIERKKISNTAIFQVGDFEVGFIREKRQLEVIERLNDFLKERNLIMYVIRGNHDDPNYFKGDHFFSNLQFLPDYSVIEVEDKKILCVGGAISIDRNYRKQESDMLRENNLHPTWWEDENFVLKEDLLKEVEGIDTVITHVAPHFCKPIGFTPFFDHYFKSDENLKEDMINERQNMTKLFQILNKNNYVKYHFYGHYHKSEITDNLYTQHICLAKNELYEY